MSSFVETIHSGSGFEHCGRILRSGEDLEVFIDEVGRFPVPIRVVQVSLLGLGEGEFPGGIIRLSASGRGLYFDINGISYVTPVSRVRAVLDGRNRKGPVSRVL